MKAQKIKKWFLYSLLFISLISLITFFLIDHEIEKLWGRHTTEVDHSRFKTPQLNMVIKNVNVLSPDGNKMLANKTVSISEGKISSISSEINFTEETVVVDGQGKYLIPGLIDSHVHLWQSPNDLLLYLANGVTHIRELNGSEEHLQWKQEIKDGRIGPNMFVASSRLNSSTGLFKGWFEQWTAKIISINTLNDAGSVVQSLSGQGYDAVKVYTFLNNDDFLAVNTAAEKINMPLLGHIPISLGFEKFWNSNLNELAHIEELVKELAREFGGYDSPNANEFLQYVHSRSEEIVSRLFTNEIAVVSTLWLMESFANQKSDLRSGLKQVQLAYVNPGISESTYPSVRAMGWLPEVNIYRLPSDYSPEQLSANRIYWETYAKAHQILLKAMVDKGVQVLAGTDANVPITVPGFSLHDELKSLTLSGMTPTQALFSATAAPANRMKIKSGRIAQGYNANLVLLNKNPLDNIENTKTIEVVIVNGRLNRRKQLNEMLDAVKQANDQSRTVDIEKFQQ